MLYGDREIFMFPLPFSIKAKYMVAILVLIVLASTLQPGPGGMANMAHLGGLLFAYLYLKFLPRRGLTYGFSERYFGARNSYYRWKRRRAARKFEVYMRKHDSKQFFDEYGNFREPETWDQKGRGGSFSLGELISLRPDELRNSFVLDTQPRYACGTKCADGVSALLGWAQETQTAAHSTAIADSGTEDQRLLQSGKCHLHGHHLAGRPFPCPGSHSLLHLHPSPRTGPRWEFATLEPMPRTRRGASTACLI